MVDELSVLLMTFNFMCKDLRLFSYYGKFPNFHVPNIVVFQRYLTNEFMDDDISYVCQVLRDLGRSMIINPRILSVTDTLHSIAVLYLKHVPRDINCDPPPFIMNAVRAKAMLLPIILTNRYKRSNFIEQLKYPYLINYVSSSLAPQWRFSRYLMDTTIEVEAAYARYLKMDFNHYFYSAKSFYRLGEYKSAIKCLEMANELDPSNLKATFLFGVLYLDLNLYHKAFEYFTEFLKNSSSYKGECYRYIAFIYLKLKDFAKSERYTRKAKDCGMNVYDLMGELQLEMGNFEMADEFFDRYLVILDNSKVINKMLNIWVPHIRLKYFRCTINKGFVSLYRGNYKDAFDKILGRHKMFKMHFRDDHPLMAEIKNQVAFVYEKLHEYDTALEYLYKALNIADTHFTDGCPIRVETISKIGSIHLAMGDTERALRYLHWAEKLQKTYSTILNYHANIDLALGKGYQALKNLDQARIYFNYALMIEYMHYGETHPSVAQCYLHYAATMKDFARKMEYYKKVLRIYVKLYGVIEHPDIITVFRHIGDAYKENGEVLKAFRYYDMGLRMLYEHFTTLTAEISIFEMRRNTINVNN